MLEAVWRVADSDASVLLLGESGTGKELVARAIHQQSPRAKKDLVVLECSGLNESLFESELFGHEKGSFTGAHSRKKGLVEAARGGTLFLDEIGDIPHSLQAKLLRLIETGTFRRLGGIDVRQADFRLLCATNRDVREMVRIGEFRQDLFFRISAFPIHLPPLRERADDVPLLVESFLQRIEPRKRVSIDPDTLTILQNYGFPGNARELRNIIERACLLMDGDTILPEHLPEECQMRADPSRTLVLTDEVISLTEVEDRYLRWVVRQCSFGRKQLAETLGLSERTLYRRLGRLRLEGVS